MIGYFAGSHNVRILLPDTGTTAFDRLALGLCTARWHGHACTLTQGHTGVHRAADGSALVAAHGSGDLEPTGQPAGRIEVVHRCPVGDSGLTPCCNRTPFDLPRYHRLTEDPALVTCCP
jgi:hypothetical protein